MEAEDDAARTLSALIEQIGALLQDVQEERRRLHRERQAVFQIVLESGHLPTLSAGRPLCGARVFAAV
jgi:hypothetical protein